MRSRTIGFCLVLLSLSPASSAAEPPELTYTEIAASQLRPSETRHVIGKYMGLVDLELQLYDLPLRFLLAKPALGRDLLAFRPNVDNVIAEGMVRAKAADEGDGLAVFEVHAIRPGPSDEQYFRDWAERVTTSSECSSESLLQLTERIHQFFVRFQKKSLFPLLEQIVVSTLEQTRREQGFQNATEVLRITDRIFKRIPVKSLQGRLLVRFSREFPNQRMIDDRLLKLGFRKREGQWLSEDEFKSVEGFVWNGQKWIKAAEHEFSVVVDALAQSNLTNLILRSRTTREYKELAKAGNIARGMSRAETVRAAGFPDRVRRRQIKKIEVDQWDYTDFRIYLMDGQALFVWSPPDGVDGLQAFEGVSEAVGRALQDGDGKRSAR